MADMQKVSSRRVPGMLITILWCLMRGHERHHVPSNPCLVLEDGVAYVVNRSTHQAGLSCEQATIFGRGGGGGGGWAGA